jgi:hypothetical protein
MTKRKPLITLIAIVLAIAVATIGRLIPHWPNATPLASIAILSGFLFTKRAGLLVVIVSLLISDTVLGLMDSYAVFGSWSLFTYSGFIFVTVFAPSLITSAAKQKLAFYALFASIGYWVWSNLGTWLMSGLYPHSLSGLMSCYALALPFLCNSMIGTLIYMVVFVICLQPVFPLLRRELDIKNA